MTTRLSDGYLEQIGAHLDNGGTLSHRNGVDLFNELMRVKGKSLHRSSIERAARDWEKARAALCRHLEEQRRKKIAGYDHTLWNALAEGEDGLRRAVEASEAKPS